MIDIEHLESLKREFHGYTLGLLWLLAIAVFAFSPEDVRGAARFIDSVAVALGHVQVPAFAVGFVFVVLGVLLPYCMFQVFEPLTLAVLNLCLSLSRLISRTAMPEDILQAAALAMRQCLGHDVGEARDRCEVFLNGFLPRVGKSMSRQHEANSFSAKALLPASLLIAAFATRAAATHLQSPWHVIVGAAVGLAIFVLGIGTAVEQLIEEAQSINMAVLIAAKDAAKAPQ